MVWGFGGNSGRAAGLALALAFLPGGGASAADLGGSCCADLDERVAELEATVARKGNRVVSLQISGTVHESLMFFDDGAETDAYLVTNTGYQSRFNLSGRAQINPDLTAGYLMTLGVWGSPSLAVDQDNDESVSSSPNAQPDSIFIRENKVYIDSKTFGRITLGQQSVAADDITSLNVSRSLHIATPAQQIYMGSFQARDGERLTGLRYNSLMGGDGSNTPGDPTRFDAIRYDTPSIGGFIVSASWGEDDYWDVALRYAGLVGGQFKVSAGIAYGVLTDRDSSVLDTSTLGNNGCLPTSPTSDVDCRQLGMSGSAMHVPTGLFAYGAYGIKFDDNAPIGEDDTSSFWYIQGGIEKKWLPYGPTTIFSEFEKFDTGFNRVITGAGATTGIATFSGADVEMWGIGINQHFESAVLDVYVKYSNYSASADNVVGAGFAGQDVDFNDFHTIYTGARIQF
jgi:hypothetical protein